jgi:hypothetical protein
MNSLKSASAIHHIDWYSGDSILLFLCGLCSNNPKLSDPLGSLQCCRAGDGCTEAAGSKKKKSPSPNTTNKNVREDDACSHRTQRRRKFGPQDENSRVIGSDIAWEFTPCLPSQKATARIESFSWCHCSDDSKRSHRVCNLTRPSVYSCDTTYLWLLFFLPTRPINTEKSICTRKTKTLLWWHSFRGDIRFNLFYIVCLENQKPSCGVTFVSMCST